MKLMVAQMNQDIDNQKRVERKKKKIRAFRVWEMTSDPKSFSLLLFLFFFFVITSFVCISDVVEQRNATKMEISRLRHDGGGNDAGQKRKKKNAPLNKEQKKKKYKIFSTSLRQAIKKEKNL